MPVINRRRNNKISYFKDANDQWITNHGCIVEHALDYFTSCFTTSHLSTTKPNYGTSYHKISNTDMSILDRPLTDFEVKKMLSSPLNPLKPRARTVSILISTNTYRVLLVQVYFSSAIKHLPHKLFLLNLIGPTFVLFRNLKMQTS